MPEKETWYAIEVSRAGAEDWFASSNVTYDSVGSARKARAESKRNGVWKNFEFRIVRKDLVTTVEPETQRAKDGYEQYRAQPGFVK